MVARLTEDLGVTRIAVLYQDDSFGRAGYRGVRRALDRRAMEPVSVQALPGARELEVILISEADTVTIEMVDDGPRFDPLQDAPLPDPEASLDERPVGGLGIHLVRTMMDEVHYRYQDGKNHLLLVTGTSA